MPPARPAAATVAAALPPPAAPAPQEQAAPGAPADPAASTGLAELADLARLTRQRRGPSLKARALRYLSQREHSRAELAAKLARHLAEDETPDAIHRTLDDLQAKGLINEARVAESLLHRRAPRLGASRVLQELRAKGLPDALLADAAAQLQATELERARQVWQRKFGRPPQSPQESARHMRFLASRGFSGDTVRRVLKQPDSEPPAPFPEDP